MAGRTFLLKHRVRLGYAGYCLETETSEPFPGP